MILDLIGNILITTFWNGLFVGLFLIPLGLVWSFNKDLVSGIFRKTTPYIVSGVFATIFIGANIILAPILNVSLEYFTLGGLLLIATFVGVKEYLFVSTAMIVVSWDAQPVFTSFLLITFTLLFALTTVSVQKAGYKKLEVYVILSISMAILTVVTSSDWWIEVIIERSSIAAFMFIVSLIAYFFAIHFEYMYDHAVKLKTLVEYERGNVVRAALSSESIKKFIKENNVHFGIFAVLGFDGSEKIRSEFGTHVLDEAVNKIIDSLNDMLKFHGVIFFKANEEKFGLLLKSKGQIRNMRQTQDGNFVEKRDDDDFIKVIENAIKQLPNHFAINDKWVELAPKAGCAIYGVHTHDIEQIIDFAEFALNTKNDFIDLNVAQLFEYSKYEIYRKDADIVRRIKEVVNINNLFAMYRPVIDLKNTDTSIYKCSFEIASVEYYGLEELFKEAEKSDTGKQLTRLLAQIGANSFGDFDKFDLLLPYDARVFDETFDIFEFLNRLKKYGADPKRIILLINSTVGYYDDLSAKEHIQSLQAAGLRVMINNIDLLGDKTFKTIDFIKPDYVGLGKTSVANVAKDEAAAETIELVTNFCHDRDIEIICDGVSSKYQLEKLIELDVDFLTGPIVGSPLPMATPPPDEVDEFILNYHDKMILKSVNK